MNKSTQKLINTFVNNGASNELAVEQARKEIIAETRRITEKLNQSYLEIKRYYAELHQAKIILNALDKEIEKNARRNSNSRRAPST